MRFPQFYLPTEVAVGLLAMVTITVIVTPEPATALLAQNGQVFETNYYGDILLRVNEVTLQPSGIAVNLEVTNNSSTAINLNSGLPGRGMILRDNLGNQYSLNPPENNRTVAVGSGETLRGTFTFSGQLAVNAQSLTLITNSFSGVTDTNPTVFPKMTIPDIPIP